MDGYEIAARAAERLQIDPSQVRRYCEQGRWPGAFKIAGRWVMPAGSFPETSGFGRPPRWAAPQTVGQIYGITEGSWRRITPEEARDLHLHPPTPERKGVMADVINFAKGMVPAPQELFSFRYVDRPIPLPAALSMGRGYPGALVVIYDQDVQGRRDNFRTLTVTEELISEGALQVKRLHDER